MPNIDVLIASAWTCLNQLYRKAETQMCLNMGRLQVMMSFLVYVSRKNMVYLIVSDRADMLGYQIQDAYINHYRK